MNFSEDLVALQGVLASIHRITGDFTEIKYRGGNERKIARVVDDLRSFLTTKKYLRNRKINSKYEAQLREINLFLILNTEFKNKSILTSDNKFAHLIDVVPQFSKCLLTNVLWGLDMCRFYAEAITCFPVPLSVELLENVTNCLKNEDPYAVLDHTAMIALTIYVKLYHIRHESVEEEVVNRCISKLLEKFTQVLQNFITPEMNEMSSWPQTKLYEYMGVAIHKILYLLRSCFNAFLNNTPGEINDLYVVNTTGPADSPERLDKSAQALKKCNICLMSVCEANLQAITVDVFCSWSENRENNVDVQQKIGSLAYEVREQLEHFEGCGNLPQMLDAIKIKPKSVEDTIREADEDTLLRNVVIKGNTQVIWFKAVLKHGIMKSEKVFNIFKSLVHLCEKEDLLYLLNYSVPYIKENNELKTVILKNITKLSKTESIEIIAEHFQKLCLYGLYETENFDTELSALLNKLSVTTEDCLPFNEITVLVLQNPLKFLSQLLIESTKNLEHLHIIVKIIEYIKPICLITNEGSTCTFLTDLLLKFLKEYDLDLNTGQHISVFINKIIASNLISVSISEELTAILEHSLQINQPLRSIIILKIMQELPLPVLMNCDCKMVTLHLADILNENRWNFITFCEEKVQIVTEVLMILKKFKDNIIIEDNFSAVVDKLSNNSINIFYFSNSTNFVEVATPGFDSNANYYEQISHLLKLLPSCNPNEWTYVCLYLMENKNPLDVLQLLIDVLLILSEISKKSQYHKSLSYCFQQFCVITKNNIYPPISEDKEALRIFIKRLCELIRQLPEEIHNTNDLSLANLFDSEILKTLIDDKEFMCVLISMSHLEITKIICNKMM